MKTVLMIGSAPDAVRARAFTTKAVSSIVAINNAWRVRDDWDYLVFPEDFPADRRPIPRAGQQFIQSDQYVPANNAYGGIIYAGATMAFTAAYWALHTLKPDLLLFTGCDMIYDQKLGPTHFYGRGKADPLRKDPTLQSLEAKATRLMLLAARKGCLCANVSPRSNSRLTFPRIEAADMESGLVKARNRAFVALNDSHNPQKVDKVLAAEKAFGQYAPKGKYWSDGCKLDAKALFEIDMAWLDLAENSQHPLQKIA